MITPRLDDCEGNKKEEKGEVPLPERMLKAERSCFLNPLMTKWWKV